MIVDYNLFKEFSFSIPKARKYIISYFNAVNMRFKTFYQPKIELNIAGVIFGKSKSSFPFISSALSNGDMLDAPASLHAMGQYYYKDRYYQFIISYPRESDNCKCEKIKTHIFLLYIVLLWPTFCLDAIVSHYYTIGNWVFESS